MPADHAAIGGFVFFQADPHRFVLSAGFGIAGIEEFAGGVFQTEDPGAAGHAVDVDVKEREEDGDADGGAADEIVVIQLGDFDYFAVGGRDQ